MQNNGKKILTSGHMTNGQMEKRIGWQDEHEKKHSATYRIKQMHQGLGTLAAFK